MSKKTDELIDQKKYMEHPLSTYSITENHVKRIVRVGQIEVREKAVRLFCEYGCKRGMNIGCFHHCSDIIMFKNKLEQE